MGVEIATYVSNWGFARIFAECIDKIYFSSQDRGRTIVEQAFEQVVSRFERYLSNINYTGPVNSGMADKAYGLLVHDNNQTVALKHTVMMAQFHESGTVFTDINHIIETPMFVDSKLTRMVQIADLCSYAIRRYVENNEPVLFDLVFQRADRFANKTVGIRHFAQQTCKCTICATH